MATYNGEEFIEEQIFSILRQLSSNDELIISDDNSNDSTLLKVNSFNDKRIKIFKNPGEKGYSQNFENALNNAKGDVIFLSDQDDVWVEDRLRLMINKLENSSLVIADAEIVNEKLETINKSHFDLYNVRKGFLVNFLKTRYIGACMCFKREVLNKAMPFPKDKKYCAHDYWLAIISEFYFSTELSNKTSILYRRHSSNALDGGNSSSNSLFKKVWTRMYCMFNLIMRYGK